MGCLMLIFELLLMLQRLDESLLRQVLRIWDIAYNSVDLNEDPPHVLGNKAILPFQQLQAGLDDFAHFAANDGFHGA